LAADKEGAVYVAGYTSSDNFPTTASAYKKESPGGGAFICKLDSEGKKLVYSTLFGGELGAVPAALAVDDQGEAIVAGQSNLFPTTEGAFLKDTPSELFAQGFVTKFDASGSRLLFSTYFGGSTESTQIRALTLERDGTVVLAGSTWASDLPAANPSQQRFLGRSLFRFSAGEWRSFELPGAQIVAVHPDGRTIYAGGANAVYRSRDGGEHWERNPVLTDSTPLHQSSLGPWPITAISFDPGNPEHVFVSIRQEGVFESTDGGVSWNRYLSTSPTGVLAVGGNPFVLLVQNGADSLSTYVDGNLLPSGEVLRGRVLTVSPDGPVPFAAGQRIISGNVFDSGFYRSDTPGLWNPISNRSDIFQLVIDPANPSTMYATASSGVVIKSLNGGRTWTEQNRGLPSGGVSFLALDPASSDTVYAVTSRGIFRSSDGAESWEFFANRPANPTITRLAIPSTGALSIFAAAIPGPDGFVARLSADGSTLLASTLIGGAGYDVITSITESIDRRIVIAGYTTSVDFPADQHAFQPAIDGLATCFVARLEPETISTERATLVGSRCSGLLPAVAVDSRGSAITTAGGNLVSVNADGETGPLPELLGVELRNASLRINRGRLGILGLGVLIGLDLE
jgi:hypothetical protein